MFVSSSMLMYISIIEASFIQHVLDGIKAWHEIERRHVKDLHGIALKHKPEGLDYWYITPAAEML